MWSVQLPLYYLIVDVEEIILPVLGLELVFQAFHRSLKLLAEFLMRLPNLLGRSINEFILLLHLGI